EQPDPQQGGERVVERAVGDEAVAARVPEVVPEREAAFVEERALVDVGGEVGARRAEPCERCCQRRGNRGGKGRLAGDRVARANDCGAHAGGQERGRATARPDPIATGSALCPGSARVASAGADV